MKKNFLIPILLFVVFLTSCFRQPEKSELKYFPVNNLNGVIANSGIELDNSISDDGNGSIKISASKPIVILLYSLDDIKVDDTQIIYEANVKSIELRGQAYLEMWCVFDDGGEYFSRGFDSVISGTTDWKTIRTVFSLQKGEIPTMIKLNIVVNGVGTIWVDDLHLSKI